MRHIRIDIDKDDDTTVVVFTEPSLLLCILP